MPLNLNSQTQVKKSVIQNGPVKIDRPVFIFCFLILLISGVCGRQCKPKSAAIAGLAFYTNLAAHFVNNTPHN